MVRYARLSKLVNTTELGEWLAKRPPYPLPHLHPYYNFPYTSLPFIWLFLSYTLL